VSLSDLFLGDVSISSTGDTLAVATGPGFGTCYLLDTGYSTIKPVGGYVLPVIKLAVLTPYLAIVGLAGAVTVYIAVKKKHID